MELTMKEFNPQVSAVEALGALAHDTRLSVFRMLVKAGPEGLIAGAIAQAANVPPSSMSHHLGILERAGLVASERESRLIQDRKSTRLNSSHSCAPTMPTSACKHNHTNDIT